MGRGRWWWRSVTGMNRVLGVFVGVGGTLGIGAMLAAGGLSFAEDHVHTIRVVGNRAYHETHMHSLSGIIAVAGLCGFAWIVLTVVVSVFAYGFWTDFKGW